MKLDLTVNGMRHSVEADPAMPLLWVLRDLLDLKGSRFGCGKGHCGACTVHLDGEPVRSCVLSASQVGKRKVTTIEGLSPDGSHPVQRAWEELDVPQCGFCQSGQLMAAAALLAHHPKPSEAEVAEAMQGNLCRCGTYTRIRKAIARASELSAAKAQVRS